MSENVEAATAPPPPPKFAWVLNVGNLSGHDSFELAPRHILRRATVDEAATLRTALSKLPANFTAMGWNIWEGPWPFEDGFVKTLPESEWRYHVIEFEGSNDTLLRITEAFDLFDPEFEIGVTVFQPGVVSYQPARFFHVTENVWPGKLNDHIFGVSVEQVAKIRTLREKLERHDHQGLDLRRFIGQLSALKALTQQSPLRFLGYFGVLEGLLTHQPSDMDTIDSITRQVKKKIALLNHRWETRLDYTPFRNERPDKIWGAMYAYRSKLAHGADANFADRDLKLLVDQKQAFKLLIATVKSVITHALEEPQLLVDLKDC